MLTINLQKKYLILFISAIILFAGIISVVAYNSGGPASYFGHSGAEINGLYLDCVNVINDTPMYVGGVCIGTATCSLGYVLVGGGCRTQWWDDYRVIYRMFPQDKTTWYCADQHDSHGCGEAYARCCKPAAQ